MNTSPAANQRRAAHEYGTRPGPRPVSCGPGRRRATARRGRGAGTRWRRPCTWSTIWTVSAGPSTTRGGAGGAGPARGGRGRRRRRRRGRRGWCRPPAQGRRAPPLPRELQVRHQAGRGRGLMRHAARHLVREGRVLCHRSAPGRGRSPARRPKQVLASSPRGGSGVLCPAPGAVLVWALDSCSWRVLTAPRNRLGCYRSSRHKHCGLFNLPVAPRVPTTWGPGSPRNKGCHLKCVKLYTCPST